jgi:hypothetical protein
LELYGDKRQEKIDGIGKTVVEEMEGTEGKKRLRPFSWPRVSSFHFQVSVHLPLVLPSALDPRASRLALCLAPCSSGLLAFICLK